MRKKVLLAEQSDATRNVAETILRQNGFEVISVADGEHAAEVLELSRPDLIILGADLACGGRPLYERIQADERMTGAPLLVFKDAAAAQVPFPDEVVIPRPFDPRDFLDRVRVFVGSTDRSESAVSNPPASLTADDATLDSVLVEDSGSIHVTDSSVMDKTSRMNRRQTSALNADQMVGFSHHHEDADELGETGRVESIVLSDSQTDIRRAETGKTKVTPAPTATGKLDILPNQYNLTSGEGGDDDTTDREHDYHWFIDEMQREGQTDGASAVSPPVADLRSDDTLDFTDTASGLEPFVMKEASPPPKQAKKNDGPGVEKFIDEFKKEIERFQTDEPESVTLRDDNAAPQSEVEWEESLESVTPQRVDLFTKRLVAELAEKIAQKIVGKIDSEKLLQLIKAEIVAHARQQGKK